MSGAAITANLDCLLHMIVQAIGTIAESTNIPEMVTRKLTEKPAWFKPAAIPAVTIAKPGTIIFENRSSCFPVALGLMYDW